MTMLLVLIAGAYVIILTAKINWKTRTAKYLIPIAVAIIQTFFVIYKMMTMELPFKL